MLIVRQRKYQTIEIADIDMDMKSIFDNDNENVNIDENNDVIQRVNRFMSEYNFRYYI